jgi:ATP-dependent exoDNAse (exonuclease V) beta subunit
MTVPKAELADAKVRRRILTDFGTTLFVEAAAGTGKTTALVGRIVALICEGISTLDRIVAVTFTEKAAGEMKLRVQAEIERARKTEDVTSERSARLAKALSQLELARIGTIHAFCGDLLRERPVEAGIDPPFLRSPPRTRRQTSWTELLTPGSSTPLRIRQMAYVVSFGVDCSHKNRATPSEMLLQIWRSIATFRRPGDVIRLAERARSTNSSVA